MRLMPVFPVDAVATNRAGQISNIATMLSKPNSVIEDFSCKKLTGSAYRHLRGMN